MAHTVAHLPVNFQLHIRDLTFVIEISKILLHIIPIKTTFCIWYRTSKCFSLIHVYVQSQKITITYLVQSFPSVFRQCAVQSSDRHALLLLDPFSMLLPGTFLLTLCGYTYSPPPYLKFLMLFSRTVQHISHILFFSSIFLLVFFFPPLFFIFSCFFI